MRDGASLAQQFQTDDKCEEQNNCADDNKRYSVYQKEGDKPGEAFLMKSIVNPNNDCGNKGKSSYEFEHAERPGADKFPLLPLF